MPAAMELAGITSVPVLECFYSFSAATLFFSLPLSSSTLRISPARLYSLGILWQSAQASAPLATPSTLSPRWSCAPALWAASLQGPSRWFTDLRVLMALSIYSIPFQRGTPSTLSPWWSCAPALWAASLQSPLRWFSDLRVLMALSIYSKPFQWGTPKMNVIFQTQT